MCVLDLLLIQFKKKLYRCPKDSLDFRRAIRKIMGGGAGEVQKKIFPQGKIKWKKIHARQVILKNIHAMA